MTFIRKKILPALIFVVPLLIYLHNLSNSVYGGDVGDFVTTAVVGGVAHPPGYPLFTLLGFLFAKIPINLTPAFKVGLISSISSAAAVFLFYLLILRLTKKTLISVISAFTLAFSYLFWFYSEIAEVFALNNLILVALFLVAIFYYQTNKNKYLYLLSFLLGLSLTNHHTIVLIFPSILIIVFSKRLLSFLKKPKNILKCVLMMLMGFSFYIYVPIASSMNPPVNWDKVHDWDSFIRLFFRKDYGTFDAGIFIDTTLEQRIIGFKNYLFTLLTQLTIPAIAISLVGMTGSFLRNKKIFFSFLLAFVITGPAFIFYAGFPLYNNFNLGIHERFFIASSITLVVFFGLGLFYLSSFIGQKFKKQYINLFLSVFFLIPVLLLFYNFPKTNLSNVWIGDNLAYDIISPLPKNSVLFLSGDTKLFNAWYVHYGIGFRKDVNLINLNGVIGDSFFLKEKNTILKINKGNDDNDDLVIQTIQAIGKKRPVFSHVKLQSTASAQLRWQPYGLLYRLEDGDGRMSGQEYKKMVYKIWSGFHVPSIKDKDDKAYGSLTISMIPADYASSLVATADYFINSYKDYDSAMDFYRKALIADPEYARTYKSLGSYYLNHKKNCILADENFKKAIVLDKTDVLSYAMLYINSVSCFKDEKKSKLIEEEYKEIFNSDIKKDIFNKVNQYKNLL
jgi:hypothetical protein